MSGSILKYYLLSLFCLHSSLKIICQDTTLTLFMDFPYNIRSMANNQNGLIFIETSVGLFEFDGKKYKLIDPQYKKGALVYRNGRLTNRQAFVNANIDFVGDWERNKIWMPFLPKMTSNLISHAKGKNGKQFIGVGNKIYGVKIKNKFKIDLKGMSTRNFSWIDSNFYVNTYEGIFKNGIQFLPDVSHADALFYDEIKGSVYFSFGNKIIQFNLNDNIINIKSYIDEIGERVYFTKIIKFQDKLFAGTTEGLVQLNPFTIFSKKIFINDISIIEEVMYISTQTGTFQFDGKKIKKCEFLPDVKTNSVVKIGLNYWASTSNGLFYYNVENKNSEKILLNKELTYLECNSIQKDNNGFYWVSTNSGLYRFRNIDEKIEVYFPEIEFNKRSCYSHDGILYFGSVNGIYSFDPLDFPDLKMNGFSLLNDFNGLPILLALFIITVIIIFLYKRKNIFNSPADLKIENKLDFSDKDKFLLQLGAYILKNLNTVTVDELIIYSGMKKRNFYQYLEHNYKAFPSAIINTVKILKAQSLKKGNSGIPMETISKYTGYSLSHLYLVLKEDDNPIQKELDILRNLKY